MTHATLARIEFGRLEGRRPRHAGKNARLGDHGDLINVPIARVTASDGATGFGMARAPREQLTGLIGASLTDAFTAESGVATAWRGLEFPLWDLQAKRTGVPVYRLIAPDITATPGAQRILCYDTSLYIDDLHLASHDEAAALIAAEAMEGWNRGHRAFKIKVGRGARHMPLAEGTTRDVLVIRAVREAVGHDARLMIDANNGYNLNIAKRVLHETADCAIYWLEEAFHEDAVLYRDLKEWLAREGLPVLIADGEGDASPGLLDWARDGLIDVVQYDIFSHGLSNWLATGRQLAAWNVSAAPHHYGTLYGNYAACHLAPALASFQFAEWDEGTAPGLDADGYRIEEGAVVIPETPGFGLELDVELFARAVTENGFTLSA